MRFPRLLLGVLLVGSGCSDDYEFAAPNQFERWVLVKYDAKTLLGPTSDAVPSGLSFADTLYLNMSKNFAVHVVSSVSTTGMHERSEALREIVRFDPTVVGLAGFAIDFYCPFKTPCPAIGGPSVARMRGDTLQFLNGGVGVVREYLMR